VGGAGYQANPADLHWMPRIPAEVDVSEHEPDRGGVDVTRSGRRAWSRWFSRRALLLHLEVAIVAPGCAVAGWWQATRALAGNALSWVYSVEWPIFALLAIAGWWHLVHEDPAAYRARKAEPDRLSIGPGSPGSVPGTDDRGAVPAPAGAAAVVTAGTAVPAAPEDHAVPGRDATVDRVTARFATALAALAVLELLTGMATLVAVSPERPTGWLPPKWAALYLAHGAVGFPLAVGAVLLVVRVQKATRLSRLSGWIGAVGVAVAAVGGLLTVSHPARLAGMALMLLGAVTAGFGYLFPTFEKLGA